MEKACTKCGEVFPIDNFYKDKSKASGYKSHCKECLKIKQKQYSYRRVERSKTFGPVQTATITTDEPYIDIWLRFDTHDGHLQVDYKYLNEYEEWSHNNDNVYQIMGGDIMETVPTIASKIPHLTSQKYSVSTQLQNLSKAIANSEGRVLGYIIGNHEGRMNKITDGLVPMLELILAGKKIPIMKDNNHLYRLHVNNVSYTFVLSHGWGGSQTPEYLIKKMFYDGLIPDQTDFIVVGHTHHNTPSIPRDKAILVGEHMATKRMIGIRPGSFLYNPSYVSHGRETIAGNVILRLSTRKWNYRLFDNLSDLQENDL